MNSMKTKLKTVIATALVATTTLSTSLTALAAPREDLYGPITAVTPGGVNVYGYYIDHPFKPIKPVPAVYLNAIDAAGITNEMSDMEKCIRVNNYLCAAINGADDSEFFTNPAWLIEKPLAEGEFALTTGNGVCRHYADAFVNIVGSLGIECKYIHSTMMNHAWNEVVIDGVTYYNDAYWNDCRGGNGWSDAVAGDTYLMSPVLWENHAYPDIEEPGIIDGSIIPVPIQY